MVEVTFLYHGYEPKKNLFEEYLMNWVGWSFSPKMNSYLSPISLRDAKKGHSLFLKVFIKNATNPDVITSKPEIIKLNPVEIKINNQIRITRMTGKGYRGILYFNKEVGFLFLSNTTPIACPIN